MATTSVLARRSRAGTGPRRLSALARAARVLVLPLGLAACAVGPADGPTGDGLARKMFATGYGHVADKYLEPVPLGTLAVAGLGGLRDLEPDLAFDARDGWLRGFSRDTEFGRVAAPAADDTDGWARATAYLLDAARSRSPKVGRTDQERLFDAMFAGMLAGLDGVSRYAGPATATRQRAARNGFGGIGVTLRAAEEDEPPGPVLVEVLADAPAGRAGLWPGDRILTIDGAPTLEMTLDEAVDRLRGSTGSTVALRVARAGEPARDVALVRAHVIPSTVTYVRDGGVARISVSRFNQGTARGVVAALDRAEREIGGALSGIVLDLRGNPGGLLDQAVTVADLFLTEGPIATTNGRHDGSNQAFRASGSDFVDGLPLAVLINGRSASATEVLAAALGERGRGVLIGTTTFGKGTVQTVLAMPNDGELTLTWSRLFGPSGRTLNGYGVLPTICTSAGPGKDGDLAGALRAGLDGLAAARLLHRTATETATETAVETAAQRDRYRDLCPPRDTMAEGEEKLAGALLADRRLYAQALAQSTAAIAQMPPGDARRP